MSLIQRTGSPTLYTVVSRKPEFHLSPLGEVLFLHVWKKNKVPTRNLVQSREAFRPCRVLSAFPLCSGFIPPPLRRHQGWSGRPEACSAANSPPPKDPDRRLKRPTWKQTIQTKHFRLQQAGWIINQLSKSKATALLLSVWKILRSKTLQNLITTENQNVNVQRQWNQKNNLRMCWDVLFVYQL